jgi:hypothetical protein
VVSEDLRIRVLTNAVLQLARAVISIRGAVMNVMNDPALSSRTNIAAQKDINESFDRVTELLESIKQLNQYHGASDA